MTSLLVNQTQDPRGMMETTNPRVDTDLDGQLDDIVTASTIDGTDTDTTFVLGMHYHPKTPLRFGLVYRQGAEFSVPQRILAVDPVTGGRTTLETFDNVVRVPDRYGLGLSGELGKKRGWVLSLDVERVEYSDLLEGFQTGRNFLTGGLIDDAGSQTAEPVFEVDDATVAHFGFEYTLRTSGEWAYGFRGGYFNSPDNQLRMTEFDIGNPEVEQAVMDVFGGGEDVNHYTVGFSFKTPVDLQLQLAGDFASSGGTDQYLFSLIWRFGKTRD